ncbi:MAG: glutathione S-transferase family protein [Alphaproteobacteria bacterium]|nr:glutathione S-transferase family protein [Alphaproteobacteria bacterium]
MLKLLGRITSINVRKVLWALDELGIGYDREDWGLPLRDPKVPEFLALNPNGQVPVLVDGDFVLWESVAVMAYVNEAHGAGALMPQDAKARALAMQWVQWQSTEMGRHWVYPLNALVRKTPGFDDPDKLAKSVAAWAKTMEIIEGQLAKGMDFVAGDRFTLADISITLGLHRWFATPIAHAPMPASEAYYRRMMQRPAAAPWLTAATP